MKLFIFIICLVCLVSCKFKKNEADYPVIPEDKFITLLVDYHLAEGISFSEYYRLKTKNFKHMNINDSVLKSNGYTKAIFDSSVSFYSAKPEKYDVIYDKVIAKLSRMQAEIQQRMAIKEAAEQKKLKKKQEEEKLKEDKKQNQNDSLNIKVHIHPKSLPYRFIPSILK
jgi:hypothetical protein